MLPLGLIFLAGSRRRRRARWSRPSRSPARSRPCAGGSSTAAARARWRRSRWPAPSRRGRWCWRSARTRRPRVVVVLGALAGLVVPPLGPVHARGARARAARARRAPAARLRARLGGRGGGADRRAAARRAGRGAALPRRGADDRGGGDARRDGRGVAHDARRASAEPAAAEARAGPLPAALWLLYGALAATAAALGAIDIARAGGGARAGPRQRGGVRAGGDGGRDGRRQPAGRAAALARAAAAGAWSRCWCRWPRGSRWRRPRPGASSCSAAALVIPGAVLGALFASLYLLADRLAPRRIGDAHVRVAGDGQQRRARARRRRRGGADGALGRRRGAVVRRGVRARGDRARTVALCPHANSTRRPMSRDR